MNYGVLTEIVGESILWQGGFCVSSVFLAEQ